MLTIVPLPSVTSAEMQLPESRGDFDFHRDKKRFGRDKDTLDLCFVAHKYGSDLVSKGCDQFVGIAVALAREDPRLRFHVVGDYTAADIALGDATEKFTFHGRQCTTFFADFYPAMDAIISINRPFVLARGAFDGFPTGACLEAGFHGVLNCINDPLALNPVLVPGRDFMLLDFNQEQSVARLRQLLRDLCNGSPTFGANQADRPRAFVPWRRRGGPGTLVAFLVAPFTSERHGISMRRAAARPKPHFHPHAGCGRERSEQPLQRMLQSRIGLSGFVRKVRQ